MTEALIIRAQHQAFSAYMSNIANMYRGGYCKFSELSAEAVIRSVVVNGVRKMICR